MRGPGTNSLWILRDDYFNFCVCVLIFLMWKIPNIHKTSKNNKSHLPITQLQLLSIYGFQNSWYEPFPGFHTNENIVLAREKTTRKGRIHGSVPIFLDFLKVLNPILVLFWFNCFFHNNNSLIRLSHLSHFFCFHSNYPTLAHHNFFPLNHCNGSPIGLPIFKHLFSVHPSYCSKIIFIS